MPAVGGGGRGNAGKSTTGAKRAARKAAPKPTPSVRPQTKTPAAKPAPKKRYMPPSARAEGSKPANQTKRAARFKKHSRAYKRAVEDAYDSLSAEGKQHLLKTAKGREGRIIRALHRGRERNAAASGRHDSPFTDADRRAVDAFKKTKTYAAALHESKMKRLMRDPHRKDIDFVHEADPDVLKAAGFAPPGLADKILEAPGQAIKAAAATGIATYHDPIGVPKKTAVQLGKAILASPSAAAEAVTHPVRTFTEAVDANAGRAHESLDESVKRIREEGALEDIGDVGVVVPAGGAIAGASAKALLKVGAPGVKPRTGRAARRVSGNKVKPVPERIGSVRYHLGKASDEIRARRADRQVRAADADPTKRVDALVRQAVETNRRAGRTVEVVPISAKVRNLKVAKAVAKARGRAVFGMKRDLAIRDKAARRLIDRLSAKEKTAFYYAAVYGIRTPKQAVEILTPLRAKIVATRKAEGFEPRGGEKAADMLPDIEAILADPPAYITPKLGETVDAITPDSLRAAREDPRLATEQATARRFAPLADVLDVHRGEVTAKPTAKREPNAEIADVAAKYMAGTDLKHDRPAMSDFVDEDRAKRIAQAFDEMKHDPDDPAVKASYDAFKKETLAQYEHAIKSGYKFEFYPEGVDPYPGGPREALADLRDNKHLYVFPTDEGFGTGDLGNHPLLEDSGIKWDGKPVTYNDIFRGIHDLYGHGQEGNGFRAVGEDNAWREHAAMFSPLARGAMTSETRGQNSWVNYGPHGEKNRTANQADTVYADQKAGLLPDFALDPTPALPPLTKVDESHADYLGRVRQAAKDAGLARPLYFRSERFADDPGFGDRAVGGVARMKEDRSYTGSNLARGIQDTAPEVYLRGLARNIKAKHNKKLVDDLLEEHTLEQYNAPNATLLELRDALTRDQVTGYAFWNPGIYRQQLRAAGDVDVDAPEELVKSERNIGFDALAAATNPDAPGVADMPGWKVIPAAALRELEAQMQPSTVVGRGYDIGKGLTSRMILLTGNIPWLGAQVVQNALGAGAATRGKALLPTNWVGAKRRWDALTDEQRQEVGGILGLDVTAADTTLARMGAHGGGFTQSYRQLKDWMGSARAPGAKGRGPQLRDFSPIQAMAKLDRLQNNAWRTTVWHVLENQEHGKRLAESGNRLARVQARAAAALATPEGTRKLIADPAKLDEIGDTVVKFMGDFATMTSFERKFLGRAVMFYPFVRFSTRLMLYTLPVEHPAVAALAAQLSLAQAEDLEEIYGPSWKFHGGDLILPDGQLVDLRKLNPLANSVFAALQENDLEKLIGVLPPFIGMGYNQASGRDYFRGSDLRIGGHATPYGGLDLSITAPVRGRILANDILSLSAAYRTAMNLEANPVEGFRDDPELHGTQGDDSLLFSPRPIHYKGTTDVGKKQAKFAEINEQFEESHEGLIQELIPFLPESTDAAERARQDAVISKMEKPAAKKKAAPKKASYFGAGG